MSQSEPLNVGVIGCGRMGRLHTRVYSQMPQVTLVGVCDADPQTGNDVAAEFDCKPFASVEELLPHVSAVTIAVPTKFHAAIAEKCLARRVGCLIEKPLAKDVESARKIVECGHEHGATVQVGHIERFNPALRAVDRLNICPRFIEVTRISPMTFRSIDVGVVLDMMIHDIDIVLKLAKSPVDKIDAVGVSVIGDVEDICNARLQFANGGVANLTASRLALKTERKMRLFSPDAYVSVDYQKRYGLIARRGENLRAIRKAVAQIRAGEVEDVSQLDYSRLVNVEELQIDDIEPLRAELDSFVKAVQGRATPEVPGEDGLAAVELATRIVGAIHTQALEDVPIA
jgi:predicted dehydrogenase